MGPPTGQGMAGIGQLVDPRGWPALVSRWWERRKDASEARAASLDPQPRFRNVCISREAGAGGGTIARMVGTRLGWKVYDHELLEAIAHRMEVSVEDARIYDELPPSMIQDWLLPLREEQYAPQEAYLDHLEKLVEAIGRAGESIIVGRGAGFLLARGTTLSVRIVAPLKVRAGRLADQLGLSQRTARRAARDLDARSLKFARTLYRVDASDPHHYDLVLDSHSLGLEIATEVLVRAVLAGSPDRTPPEKPTTDPGAFDFR